MYDIITENHYDYNTLPLNSLEHKMGKRDMMDTHKSHKWCDETMKKGSWLYIHVIKWLKTKSIFIFDLRELNNIKILRGMYVYEYNYE